MNLFELEGESVPDSLISGTKIGTMTRGIKLAPGQGLLKRGTLLARNAGDEGVIFSGNEASPSGILTDDADTGTDDSGQAVVAEEYITGVFNPDAVTVGEGTGVRDHAETLRKLGIFFEEVE